jgi:hypothetical protein
VTQSLLKKEWVAVDKLVKVVLLVLYMTLVMLLALVAVVDFHQILKVVVGHIQAHMVDVDLYIKEALAVV